MRLREVACVGAPRTLLLAETGDVTQATISISAAVHGDEPAAAWALLSLVEDRLLDPRFAYRLWPCLNPTGFDAGTRANAEGVDVNRTFTGAGASPEARAVLTANRDRTFAMHIDLHEDFEADGFYMYEPVRPHAPSRFARDVTAAIVDAGFALQVLDASYDLGTPPEAAYTQTLAPGTVIVDAFEEAKFFSGSPIAIRMLRRATSLALTFETPSRRPLPERIAMHRVAVVNALTMLAER